MSILKKKVAYALKHKEAQIEMKLAILELTGDIPSQQFQQRTKTCSQGSPQQPSESPKPKKKLSGNNIMKNYCRAFANFAVSAPAKPYLDSIVLQYQITVAQFHRFISRDKQKLNCIHSLRNKLLIFASDSDL